MMKKLVFTAALWSLVVLGGCAKGGGGPCAVNCPSITVEGHSGGLDDVSTAGLNLTMTFTATFVHATQGPVNWNLTGTSCTNPTDSSNPCGYFTSTNGTTASYQAPSSVPSDSHFNVIATSQSDGSLSGSLPVGIIPDVADVAPLSVNVGVGLKQQYTAVAVPDQAPQTFTWTCMASGVPCANFSQDPNISGLAYYTPTSNEKCSGGGNCVVVSALATIDPTGCSVDPKFPCNPSATTVVSDRVPTGTYAFQFSGYDKNGKAIFVAGTFTADSSGSISGYEDELTAGGLARRAFSGGSYTPINGSDPNANNAGTLSLNTGAFPGTYQVVLDGAGDLQMIASDGAGDSGSGVAVSSSITKFNLGTNATFAFGFTGVDANNNRVGYVGLLPTDGVSAVTSGLIDVNDNGSATNGICNVGSACAVAGSYAPDGTVSNLWHLTLTSPVAMTFDFFVANGNTSANNPLNLYAISTDSNPAVVGTMTLQNSKIAPYNNAALSGTSVSALTGANDNVALVLGTTDGSSSGTGGTGNFTGTFDWNNSGVITSVPPEVPCTATVCSFANTYVSTNNSTGRYTLQMLGTPNASPAGSPIPFVLYASGANRGYLLDPSSAAVIAGTMNAQTAPKQNAGFFASSAATGTYAVATNSNSVSSIAPLTMNLLLTSPGAAKFNVTGVQNPGTQSVSGSYTVGGSGNGAITLTAPAKSSYVIYGTTETTFFMIDLDSGVTSPMFYMAQ